MSPLFNQTITVPVLRAALLRIAERFGPAHKAENPNGGSACTYAVNEDGVLTPVCIVGQFFADMGLLGLLTYAVPVSPDDTLDLADACAVGTRAWSALADLGITVTEDAQNYARLAQVGQDAGLTWSKAIEYADDRFIFDKSNDARKTIGLDNDYYGPTTSNEKYQFAPEPETLDPWEQELLNGN